MDFLCTIKSLFQSRNGCKFIGYSESGVPRWKCDNNNQTSQQVSTETSNNGSPFSDFDGGIIQDPRLITSQGTTNEQNIFNGNMLNYLLLIGGGVVVYSLLVK